MSVGCYLLVCGQWNLGVFQSTYNVLLLIQVVLIILNTNPFDATLSPLGKKFISKIKNCHPMITHSAVVEARVPLKLRGRRLLCPKRFTTVFPKVLA